MRRSLALLIALAIPGAAHAQGTLSAQGLGYPPGQFSTFALSTGGAFAGLDPASPLNPAAIVLAGSTTLFVHYAPESRTVEVGEGSGDALVARFPLFGAILPAGSRGALGLAASTLLDRSWITQREVGGVGDEAPVVESFQSRGSITDVRLAGAWRFSQQLQVGLGAHAITGSNQLTVTRFDPNDDDLTFEQFTEVGFSGTAFSAGAVWNPSRLISVEASGQVGGAMRARLGDSTIARADAPARAGGSIRYTGITGAALAVRADWAGWSALDDLGGADFEALDSWSYGIGADVAGPSLFGAPLAVRVGAQWRDLPFQVLGEQPTEQAFTGGLGVPLARGRVMLDLALQRARREITDVTETAWTFGAGLTVRP